MSKIAFILVVITFLSAARSQTWTGPNQLQPVHGLYVKPSSDGTTGDLYVAATEDSGTKAQWLTDQPINFLPTAASTHTTASQAIPLPYSSHPEESSSTKKRAVITSPPVAPVHYTYAIPFNPTEGAQLPYPYTISTSSTSEAAPATQCEKAAAAAAATPIPYNPFQFFYPHIMQAYANAKTVLKESGVSDEKASSVVPQASPFWPSSYSYPSYPMYVMVDPSAWAHHSQSTQTAANSANTESSPK